MGSFAIEASVCFKGSYDSGVPHHFSLISAAPYFLNFCQEPCMVSVCSGDEKVI